MAFHTKIIKTLKLWHFNPLWVNKGGGRQEYRSSPWLRFCFEGINHFPPNLNLFHFTIPDIKNKFGENQKFSQQRNIGFDPPPAPRPCFGRKSPLKKSLLYLQIRIVIFFTILLQAPWKNVQCATEQWKKTFFLHGSRLLVNNRNFSSRGAEVDTGSLKGGGAQP